MSWFYPVVSMTVGYYFITLHYLAAVLRGATRLMAEPRQGARTAFLALAGAAGIAAVVWGVVAMLLSVGAHPLIALAVIFVALTLAGMPIVFMLSVVGILAFLPSFLGLEFWPRPDPLVPFSTSQSAMGLNSGSELIVILMFLVTAEVMNASGMSLRLIAFAAALRRPPARRHGLRLAADLAGRLGHLRLGPGRRRDHDPAAGAGDGARGLPARRAAAVVAGASIKGDRAAVGMFIVYGSLSTGASVNALLLSGLAAVLLLLVFQMATVYVRAPDEHAGQAPLRRLGDGRAHRDRRAAGAADPFIILGGIFSGVFTPTKSASVAALIAIGLALFWFADMSPRALPRVLVMAGIETGIVMLLSATRRPRQGALLRPLRPDAVGFSPASPTTGTSSAAGERAAAAGRRVHRAAAGALHPGAADSQVAINVYGIDPVHFGLIMVFNLVLALIHPPLGLVIFLVSSLSKVSVERLSIMILPWLAVSLVVLFLVTYLPTEAVLALSNLIQGN